MSLRSSIGSLVSTVRETVMYTKYKLSGMSYADYYGERMNDFIRRSPNWGMTRNKKFQLDYLAQRGMKPETKFLDLGCGAVNAGLYFIEFLNPNCYTGTDVSKDVLEAGTSRIAEKGLSQKNPTLVYTPAGDLGPLGTKKFDVIWAQSVLTHMPPQDVNQLFKTIQKNMHDQSKFYFTISACAQGFQQRKFKDWYYSVETMKEMVLNAGLTFEVMKDWKHPDDTQGIDTLICVQTQK